MATQRERQDLFRMQDGCTSIFTEEGYDQVIDCTLEFIAEASGAKSKDGQWLCVCETYIHETLVRREIMLGASSFDSREKFIRSLRDSFSSGSYFALSGGTTSRHISDLYSFLKKRYRMGPRRKLKLISHVGHQENGYWFLSEKVHFKDGMLLQKDKHEYFCANAELREHNVEIQEDLLKSDYFECQIKRFLSLCGPSFGINEHAFLAATAFVLWRLISNADPTERSTGDMANIGLICSAEQSIGKTTALKILAYGQGVPNLDHPLLMSLGDQCHSGTSVKKISMKLADSTLVSLLDDGCMTSTLEESLLQLQGGLMQGSLKRGNVVPKGSVLLTSNVAEKKRLAGRVIKFLFQTQESGFKQVELALKKLFAVVEGNKGLLTLWAITNAKLFEEAKERNVLVDLAALLSQVFPKQQSRWVKGLAGVIITQALLCLTTGKEDDMVSIFKAHVSLQSSCQNTEAEVLQNVQMAIFCEIKKDPSNYKVLSWLNPLVRVNMGKKEFVESIGLKNKMISEQWPDVNLQDVKRVIKNVGESTVDVSIPFSSGEAICSIQDLRSRTSEKVKSQKGVKIPRTMLNRKLVQLIDLVTQSAEKENIPEKASSLISSRSPIPGEIKSTASSGPQLEGAVLQQLKMVEKTLQKIITAERKSKEAINNGVDDEGSLTSASEPSSPEMSPRSTGSDNSAKAKEGKNKDAINNNHDDEGSLTSGSEPSSPEMSPRATGSDNSAKAKEGKNNDAINNNHDDEGSLTSGSEPSSPEMSPRSTGSGNSAKAKERKHNYAISSNHDDDGSLTSGSEPSSPEMSPRSTGSGNSAKVKTPWNPRSYSKPFPAKRQLSLGSSNEEEPNEDTQAVDSSRRRLSSQQKRRKNTST